MGKYSGKVLTVYITPSGVRVCEGENRSGNPEITKFFVVHDVASYFSDMENQTPEIVNMSGLVSAIVDGCKAKGISARRVLVASDCFGIQTTVSELDNIGGLKGAMSGDVKNVLKNMRRPKEEVAPDQMSCRVTWGVLPVEGKMKTVVTSSVGDKYLLKSLVNEFYQHGYDVIFVSGAFETLCNFRQAEPSSFDSQGKIIFDLDVSLKFMAFKKDLPLSTSTLMMLDKDEMQGRLSNLARQALVTTGRNPLIFLTGSVFADTEFYGVCIDLLESEGYRVFDFFGRPELPPSYEEDVRTGVMSPVLTPDYSVNIALLLCGFTKSLITLTPSVELGDILHKNSKAVATLAFGLSTLVFLGSLAVAGLRVWDLYQMSNNPSNLGTLQNQVASLTAKQTSLNATIATLTQADTTVLELMKFIDTNQSDRVCVTSVDTRDMLSADITVDTTGTVADIASTADAAVDAVEGAAETVTSAVTSAVGLGSRESIVIRGFARTGNEAITYYDRLFNYGFSSDPVLNGVERAILPDGDVIYVFEIEIGGSN